MTEAEKQAIETLRTIKRPTLATGFERQTDLLKAIETILNLIEKKDKIIDEMAIHIYKNIDILQMLDIAKNINYDLEKVFNGLEDKEVLNILKEYFIKLVEDK